MLLLVEWSAHFVAPAISLLYEMGRLVPLLLYRLYSVCLSKKGACIARKGIECTTGPLQEVHKSEGLCAEVLVSIQMDDDADAPGKNKMTRAVGLHKSSSAAATAAAAASDR